MRDNYVHISTLHRMYMYCKAVTTIGAAAAAAATPITTTTTTATTTSTTTTTTTTGFGLIGLFSPRSL